MNINNENWKKLILDGYCQCAAPEEIELIDEMADRLDPKVFMCGVCNKEMLPCKYCKSLPCKCVQLNNEVDEARGN